MKYTKKSDDKYDKKHGIKEGSKKDIKLDKKRGIAEEKKKVKKILKKTMKKMPAVPMMGPAMAQPMNATKNPSIYG